MATIVTGASHVHLPVDRLIEKAHDVSIVPIFLVSGTPDPKTGAVPIYRVNLHVVQGQPVRQMAFPKDTLGRPLPPMWFHYVSDEHRPDCECLDFQGRAFDLVTTKWNGHICKHIAACLMKWPNFMKHLLLLVNADKRIPLGALANRLGV